MVSSTKYMRSEDRRRVIVETVLALAAQQNPGDITTGGIAARMGLTQGALFRHFPNKNAVWEAVMEWIATKLLSKVEASAAAAPTRIGALESVFTTHVDFVCRHPGVPRIVLGELQRPEDGGAKRVARVFLGNYRQLVEKLIEAGQAAGEIDPSIDVRATALLFVGAIQGLIVQSMLEQNVQRIRKQAPGVFATFRRGIEKRS